MVVGLLAALVVSAPQLLTSFAHRWLPSLSFTAPIFVLVVTFVAAALRRVAVERGASAREYHGLADLLVHVHSPGTPEPGRWTLRGLVSFLLALFGGSAGAEGAAVEWSQAFAMRVRARGSRWFEQRRRTDAASTLAAGVAAAFGSPFAAVLLPIELGIGGRAASTVVTAFAAYLVSRAIASLGGLQTFDLGGTLYAFHFENWREWIGIPLIALAVGAFGAGLARFVRYCEESLLDLARAPARGQQLAVPVLRTLLGGVLLFLVALVYKAGHAPAWSLLEQVLWGRRSVSEVGLLVVSGTLSLSLVLSGFGTIGLLWPLFALGGILGWGLEQGVVEPLVGSAPGFAAAAGLAGGAALWGAVLGAPLSGAVLGYELAHDVHVLVPCFLAGFLGREARRRLRTRSLVELDLGARGLVLLEGRSRSVLGAITVREAMVSDYQTVREHEPVSEIHARLLRTRSPFMPVVNAQGAYVGLITIDMVEEAWQAQSATSNSPLSRLLEAKDLLYRSGFNVRTVREGDRLEVTHGMFNEIPCVPVLADDGKVAGLLYVYNVRLAYDREVERRSLGAPEQA